MTCMLVILGMLISHFKVHIVVLTIIALKKYNFEEEKVLILISSLMVWNQTPNKMKEIKEGKEGEEEEGENPDGEDGENKGD
jgi:hypothetical protein